MTTIKDRLDNVLVDWASPKTRRRVHALLELAFFIAAGFFAVGGDWGEFVGFLLLGGYSDANRANTHPVEEPVDEPVEVGYVHDESHLADDLLADEHPRGGGA